MVQLSSNNALISSANPLAVSLVNSSGGIATNVNILTNNSNITNSNPLVVTPVNTQLDSFGRMRFSEPYTVADYKNTYGIDTNYCFYGSNGGFSNFVKYKASAQLSNITTSGATSILQSYMYHNYQPGKSQLVLQSFNFNGYTCNATKRVGYFDDNDGIYVELSGTTAGGPLAGTLSFNIRSSVGYPTVSTQQAIQGTWNIDNLNGGSGGVNPSGLSLNMSNVQLFFTDFQWLGVGRVRCGFVIGGAMIDCHEFNCANISSNVYMTTGTLPIRSEIRNVATLASPTTLNQICATVISEGGYENNGADFSYITNTAVTVNKTITNYPVFAIKLSPTVNTYPNHAYIKLVSLSLYSTLASVSYNVIKLSSSNLVTGGAWYNIGEGSVCQYSSNMTSLASGVTIGNCITSGFAMALGGAAALSTPAQSIVVSTTKRNIIANNIQCTDSQIYVICVSNNIYQIGKTDSGGDNNTVIYSSLQWQEIY
jgi:hypothetical protein